MEILAIKQLNDESLEMTLKTNDGEKTFRFRYWSEDIFAVDFPEDLRKILRPLPAPITQSLVKTIKSYLEAKPLNFPVSLKTRRLEKLAA